MDHAGKTGYLQALVACSVHRRWIMACPVAFGEVSVKTRIKDIINYRKPAFWISLAAVAACVIVAVCFLTNPAPCEHIYHGRITAAPSCTQTGVETLTCELCQHSYTVTAEQLAHTYGEGRVVKAPTCAEPGSEAWTCTGCGGVKTEEIPMEAHTYGEGTVIDAPTCIALGNQVVVCTGCGAKQVEAVEMTAHIAGDPIVVTEANCTDRGEVTATCTYCQAVFVSEILEPNDVHDFQETVVRASTCAQAGEGLKTCSRCGHSETCTYETLPHNYVAGQYLAPTCFKVGLEQEVCTDCGAEAWYEVPLDETNHHYTVTNMYGDVTCPFCGATLSYGTKQRPEYSLVDEQNQSASPSKDTQLPVIVWDVAAN